MRSRAFRILFGGLVAGATACAGFVLLRPAVEAEACARIEREARRLGLSTTLGSVHLKPWLAFELGGLVLERAGHVRLMTQAATVRPHLSFRGALGRAALVHLGRTVVELPAGVRLEVEPSTWAVESDPPELHLHRLRAGERLDLELRRESGIVRLDARATNARLHELVRILVHGCPIADPGIIDGDGRLERDASRSFHVTLRVRVRSLAVGSWAAGDRGCDTRLLGPPTDAELEGEALLQPAAGSLRANRFRLTAGGTEALGRLAVDGGLADPRIELDVRVPRVDFARLLAAAGLDPAADDLGRASLTARVTGPLLDPGALRVTQRLDFTPPARPLPSIERLRGPFVHRAGPGGATLVRVDPESPEFVPLADVPPLFVKTLLLGEDANFYGHRGVDLTEVPAALARNLARGTFASGASTIPQQLAKNLFLSREKTVSRKLEELALALLLDSSLGKERLLEIYLNVIEWGPGLYGLGPAARHYFGKRPRDLTPRQMAFLVSLIPGPIKYQRSFAGGVPTPFFEGLMATLLAKLHAVGALSDEEYQLALAEPLDLRV